MATTFQTVANNAVSTLATTMNTSVTTAVVQSGEGALFPASGPFHITIESEILICTSRSGDTLTVSRSAESTTAASHTEGTQVALNIISKHISDLNTAVNAVETILATSGGLRGNLSDETGTGGAVFATEPTLASPVLNTGVSGSAISTDTALGTSNTLLSSQGAIKSYVDTRIATEDTIAELNDTNIGSLAAGHLLVYDNTASVWDNVALSGGTGLTATLGDGTLALAIDSTVATLAGSQVLTSKTLTAPTINGVVGGTQTSATITALTISSMAGNWTNAGRTVADMGIATTIDINGGTIDGAVIGGETPAAIAGTTGTFSGVVDITNTTDASDATGDTGALRTEGGASIAAKLYVGTDLDVDGTANLDDTDIDGTLVVDGSNISLDSTTTLNIDNSNTSNGISIGTATASVPINIGHGTSLVTIGDNLTVTGDLTVSGTTTTVTSTTVAIADSLLLLAKDQGTSADAVDFGIYGKYGVEGTAKYAGIFRDVDVTGDPWTFFDTLEAEPGTTVNVGGTGYDLADISAGGITAADGFTGDLTGNADTATALATTRAIAVGGDVTGTANFDGSAAISITTTLANDAIVTANITNANVTVAKMAANSVDSDQYVDGSIDNEHIANGTIALAKTALVAGTNITLATNTLNVDDAFLKNDASDTTTGTITAAGFTASDDSDVILGEAGKVNFADVAPDDGEATGVVLSFIADVTLAVGDLVYIVADGADGKVGKADSSAAGTMPAIGVAVTGVSADAAVEVLVQGLLRRNSAYGFTIGQDLFVSETPAAVTATAPTTSGAMVQKVGVALHADIAYYNFNTTVIEHA